MDFSNVVVQEEQAETDGDLAALISSDGTTPKSIPPIWSEVSSSHIKSLDVFFKNLFTVVDNLILIFA